MSQSADILITNARALTIDRQNPRASVIAVKGNRIQAVGGEELLSLAGPDTQNIDENDKLMEK